MSSFDYLIVGAGFAGSVCAQQLAESGKRVLLVDKRPHIGGNAFDRFDENGILIHPYGPHIFHTNSKRIFEYLSQFTDWRYYEHRVLAEVDGDLYPLPFNKTTINSLYDLQLTTEEDVQNFLESVRIPKDTIKTSEDVVLNSVGEDLCEKFFRGYTKKQWGRDLSELSAGVASRIPTRTNDDDRYFTDTFQFMPSEGYTRMFERMLGSPNITIKTGTDYRELDQDIRWIHTIYTGPVDQYFDYSFGRLPYRSLNFQFSHLTDVEHAQAVGTVNYPNQHTYTRTTEFKHLTGQKAAGTTVMYEFPSAEGDPYYPVLNPESQLMWDKYLKLIDETQNVTFIGRLAEFKYYNMDQVVGSALKASKQLLEKGI